MEKTVYTVPFDFTPVTKKALDYAIFIAQKTGDNVEVKLIHVVEDPKDISTIENKLDQVILEQETFPNISFSKDIRVGSIFTAINKSASDTDSSMVFMGTHGMKGLQKFTGSYAMKVITSSDLPFIIVQEDTELKDITHIAIPIDYTGESIQITQTAAFLAKTFGAKISILYENYNDIGFRTKLGMRINLIKETYTDKRIDFEIKELIGKGGTLRKFMKYVDEHKCDMVSLSYFSEALFPQFDTFAQNLITNRQKLPCLIVSAVQTTNTYY